MIPALHLMHFLEVYIVSGPVKLKIEQQVSHHHLLLLLDRRIVTNQIVYGWSASRMHTDHTHTPDTNKLCLFSLACIVFAPAVLLVLAFFLPCFPPLLFFAVAVVLHLHGHTTTCRDLIFLLTLPEAGIFPNAWHASPINFFKPPSFLSSSSEYIINTHQPAYMR